MNWSYQISTRPWSLLPLLLFFGWLGWKGAFTTEYLGRLITSPAFWVLLVILLILAILELDVKIENEKLRYRFIPFLPFWRDVPLQELETARLIHTGSLSYFGGWGLRFLGGKEQAFILPFYGHALEIKTSKGKTLYFSCRSKGHVSKWLSTSTNQSTHNVQ